MKYDLMIRGAYAVDPKNGFKGVADIGIVDGKVADVRAGIAGADAREIIDLSGYHVMPGIIDTHVHAQGTAHRQMAKAGVCTCLDMGAMREVIEEMPLRGCGLNVAGLQVIPNYPDSVPSVGDLMPFVEKALEGGAIGIKLVGGHRPSTPEATANQIQAGNDAGCYVAFHVGTTRNGSNLNGLIEAIELVGDNRLHIAHVNSYLRGMVKDPVEEVVEGLKALQGKKNLVSESYLAIINGTGGHLVDGLPQSHVTRNCLKMKGYEVSGKGLEKAILDGYGIVQVEEAGETVMKTGAEGVAIWHQHNTAVLMSFPVNQPISTFLCAVKKDHVGEFIVDAISTDGGSIPRNVIVSHGLALVKYQALTLDEFVLKSSTTGAAMLGLPDKGHLGVGADADITAVDMDRGEAIMTVVAGKVIMAHGVVYGRGGTVITTDKGVAAAKAVGLPYRVVDPQQMLIYTKGK